MARQPKGIEYRAEYEPDMDRMVKALRVLLEYIPEKEDGHEKNSILCRKEQEIQKISS